MAQVQLEVVGWGYPFVGLMVVSVEVVGFDCSVGTDLIAFVSGLGCSVATELVVVEVFDCVVGLEYFAGGRAGCFFGTFSVLVPVGRFEGFVEADWAVVAVGRVD